MWKFLKHILERMRERNIIKEEILSILNLNVNVLIIPSDKDKNIDLYFGKTNKKYFWLL